MAWGSTGTAGSAGTSGAGTTTALTTATNNLPAGGFGVVVWAGDNVSSGANGDENLVTSVTDSAGNVWSKAAEFSNTQGAGAAGSCCSIWYTNAKIALNTGGTITVNHGSTGDRCVAAWVFTKLGTAGGAVKFSATLADGAADPWSLDVTTGSGEYLRVRGIGSEINSTTAITATASWTTWALTVRSRNNTLAQTVRVEHRIFTGTNAASDPTYAAADHASVIVAFEEDVLRAAGCL